MTALHVLSHIITHVISMFHPGPFIDLIVLSILFIWLLWEIYLLVQRFIDWRRKNE